MKKTLCLVKEVRLIKTYTHKASRYETFWKRKLTGTEKERLVVSRG